MILPKEDTFGRRSNPSISLRVYVLFRSGDGYYISGKRVQWEETAMTEPLQLYESIRRYISAGKVIRRLNAFKIESEDAMQALFVGLYPYARHHPVVDADRYVRHWAPKHLSRLIDKVRRHDRTRDNRELL
jgi:hypothetical protein